MHVDGEISARIAKASVAFGRLRGNVWDRNEISLTQSFKSTTLWYCQPSYIHVRSRHYTNAMLKDLTISTHAACESSKNQVARQGPGYRGPEEGGNAEQSVQSQLKLAQLRWTGHVTRMPDERLPKKVFYGELLEGKRSQCGQMKHYKHTLKASLNDFNIPPESWEQIALDRTK